MKTTRPHRQKLRSRLLTKINTRINELVTITPGLHRLVGRCMYIAKLGYGGDVEVSLYTEVSAVRVEPSKRMIVSNKALYAKQSFWGHVEISNIGLNEFKCQFVREKGIKHTHTFAVDYLLIKTTVACGRLYNASDVDLMFQDYREFELTSHSS